MSYYGGTVTVSGRKLITSLIAGETIEFTRVMVGSGSMPEGVEPIDMVDLVTPVAEGVSSVPTVENNVLGMVVEYRNDLNGGLQEGFWLREFGVFAKTKGTEEVLLYYATLGDSPQPVNAFKDNRVDIRRYPISIALELDVNAQIAYNPGAFITSGEANDIIQKLVHEAVERIDTAVIKEITIPHEGWTLSEKSDDEYVYYIDVPIEEATETHVPSVSLHKNALGTADFAGICPTASSQSGTVRFWSERIPREDMEATVTLISPGSGTGAGGGGGGSTYVLPVATATRLGGVKIGKGISVEGDGTITASSSGVAPDDMASAEDTESMLNDVFSSEESNSQL